MHRNWVLVDVEKSGGRARCIKMAQILGGNTALSTFLTSTTADFVMMIINAAKVKFTGKKLEKKNYLHRIPRAASK